jgi:hypothetical protein
MTFNTALADGVAIREETKKTIRRALTPIGLTHLTKKGLTLKFEGVWRGHEFSGSIRPAFDGFKKCKGFMDLSVGLSWSFKGAAQERADLSAVLAEEVRTRLTSEGCFVAGTRSPLSALAFRLDGPPPAESGSRGYREEHLYPGVVSAWERREDWRQRLAKFGACQINFGSEFITSSYAMAADPEELRPLVWRGNHTVLAGDDPQAPSTYLQSYECSGWTPGRDDPDDVIRFDPILRLFWVPCGASD